MELTLLQATGIPQISEREQAIFNAVWQVSSLYLTWSIAVIGFLVVQLSVKVLSFTRCRMFVISVCMICYVISIIAGLMVLHYLATAITDGPNKGMALYPFPDDLDTYWGIQELSFYLGSIALGIYIIALIKAWRQREKEVG